MHTTFRPILDTLKMIPPIGIEDTPFQIFWVRILKDKNVCFHRQQKEINQKPKLERSEI